MILVGGLLLALNKLYVETKNLCSDVHYMAENIFYFLLQDQVTSFYHFPTLLIGTRIKNYYIINYFVQHAYLIKCPLQSCVDP